MVDHEDENEELLEYKENSYDQYVDLLEQKTRKEIQILMIDDIFRCH